MSQPLTDQRRRAELIAELYDRHAAGLFAYCADQLGDLGSASDVLVTLFSSVAGVPSAAEAPRAALYAFARREIHRRDIVFTPPSIDPLIDPASALVERTFRELRPHQREVLVLCAVCGLSKSELAWVLDVAPDTAEELAVGAGNHFRHALVTALSSTGVRVPKPVADVYGALSVAPLADIISRLPWSEPPGALRIQFAGSRSATPGPLFVKPRWPSPPMWPQPLADEDPATSTGIFPAELLTPPSPSQVPAHGATTAPMPKLNKSPESTPRRGGVPTSHVPFGDAPASTPGSFFGDGPTRATPRSPFGDGPASTPRSSLRDPLASAQRMHDPLGPTPSLRDPLASNRPRRDVPNPAASLGDPPAAVDGARPYPPGTPQTAPPFAGRTPVPPHTHPFFVDPPDEPSSGFEPFATGDVILPRDTAEPFATGDIILPRDVPRPFGDDDDGDILAPRDPHVDVLVHKGPARPLPEPPRTNEPAPLFRPRPKSSRRTKPAKRNPEPAEPMRPAEPVYRLPLYDKAPPKPPTLPKPAGPAKKGPAPPEEETRTTFASLAPEPSLLAPRPVRARPVSKKRPEYQARPEKPRRRRDRHFDWAWEVVGFLICVAIAMIVFFSMPVFLHP
ncbi:hypothetical protein [Nonomuraea sp. NPDC005650]|uniref:RNA polymerase sigma factor n=1 Tax=Nonomuraea sp. NPDC005650 TaxID=3157045 RepID=UPI0033ACF581